MMKIRVYNVAESEVFTFSLPLLLGEIDGLLGDGILEVWNSSIGSAQTIRWPIIEGCFKLLVDLQLGRNAIKLKYCDEILTLHLVYEDPGIPFFVRPVYVSLADDNGWFQGPEEEDCSPESAKQRITLGARLIQTFTAEKMKEHGFGRITFQLELDESHSPVCHWFVSKLTLPQAYAMSGNELWNHFAKELMTSSLPNKDRCKWYCFMSFTRYNPPEDSEIPKTHSEILRHTKGHTALGGGGLALFGTGNLHTWARTVNELHDRFTDCRKINRRKLMDDSAYREYYWANYATGLGASLHELSHTFDLAHTPTGIMARGFDDMHKVFTVQRIHGGRTSESDENWNYRISRTPSDTSLDDSPSNTSLDVYHRRYKNICYGSPFKRLSRSNSSNSMYIPPPPLIVKVETGFKPVKSSSMLTISVKNYDGTETKQTISQGLSGDTASELVLDNDGKVIKKPQRDRLTNSCSSISSISSLSLSSTPSTLPNSPDEPDLSFPKIHFTDDGAHWYRSSAVMLRFHKWFNKPSSAISTKKPTISSKYYIKSLNCLRLVELRSDPGGMVFQHWEFLDNQPPSQFILKRSKIHGLPEGAEMLTVAAEDCNGNILKKRIKVVDLDTS